MEQDQSMEVIIHRLAREALQNRRAEAKGSDRELLDELETLSTEVKALMEQLPAEKKHMLETYLKKIKLLSEHDRDYLYFQGAKDCMELFGKLEQVREKK
ncbi:hypothetical protein [Hungatella effluvii]|uniref:hypothetical protein n=1 Tax=Hungatella effluvii TaxID=1096246 RepID=UPI002A806A92|nr:hypothetical protein [Hungatella effluvii]